MSSIKHKPNPAKTDQMMYEFLFEQSPISMWEEDFSGVVDAVDALPESARQDLSAYFEANPDEIDRFIKTLQLININSQTLVLFEADSRDDLLKNLNQTLTRSSRKVFVEQIIALYEGAREYTSQIEFKSLKGRLLHVSLTFRVIEDPAGEALFSRVLVLMTDIGKSVLHQRELEEERDKVSRYLNLSNVLFVSLNPQGLVKMVNHKTCAILNLPQDSIVGKKWIQTYVKSENRDSENAIFSQITKGETTYAQNHESLLSSDQSEPAIIEWHNAILRNVQNEVEEILYFGVDVTQARRLERSNMAMRMQLQQTQKMRSLSVLAGGIAHEINNPMTAVMNYASIIADEDQDPELREYAQDIQEEGQRVTQIVSNFLKFARIDSSGKKSVQISMVLNSVKLLINQTMMKESIQLNIDTIDPKLFVEGKIQSLQHVLFNLLMNAWEAIKKQTYAKAAKRVITVHVRTFESHGTEWLRILIEDNGIGMPKEFIETHIAPFLTGAGESDRIGLGLLVARDIILEHGGQLLISSKENQGTTASIDLKTVKQGVFL